MRKILCLFVITSMIAVSCQKELSVDTNGTDPTTGGGGGGTNTSLTGTWKFEGMHVVTNSVIEANEGGTDIKTVTNSTYDTRENSGTYTINPGQMLINNVGYSIDTTVTALYYIDGVFQDSFDAPFQYPYTTQTGSSSYKLVGADSMYFTSGNVLINTGSAGSSNVTAQPSGLKYNISGNTLTFTFSASKDTTIVSSGVSAKVKQMVSGNLKLSK